MVIIEAKMGKRRNRKYLQGDNKCKTIWPQERSSERWGKEQKKVEPKTGIWGQNEFVNRVVVNGKGAFGWWEGLCPWQANHVKWDDTWQKDDLIGIANWE